MTTVEMIGRARRLCAALDARKEQASLADIEPLAACVNATMPHDEPVAVPTAAVLAGCWPASYRAAAALLRRGAVLVQADGGPICGPGSELWGSAVECYRQADVLNLG